MLKMTPIWPHRLAKLTQYDFEHLAQCAEHIWGYVQLRSRNQCLNGDGWLTREALVHRVYEKTFASP